MSVELLNDACVFVLSQIVTLLRYQIPVISENDNLFDLSLNTFLKLKFQFGHYI